MDLGWIEPGEGRRGYDLGVLDFVEQSGESGDLVGCEAGNTWEWREGGGWTRWWLFSLSLGLTCRVRMLLLISLSRLSLSLSLRLFTLLMLLCLVPGIRLL